MTFLPASPPLTKPYIVGALEAPSRDDPQFDGEDEALRHAMKKSDGRDPRVMAVWLNDDSGEVLYVAYAGEAFKKH